MLHEAHVSQIGSCDRVLDLSSNKKCEAIWGEIAVDAIGNVGVFGEAGMKLFERLVVGVENMGKELKAMNGKLDAIKGILWEGAEDEAQEIMDEGFHAHWFDQWRTEDMEEEVKGLEEENEVFLQFLQTRGNEGKNEGENDNESDDEGGGAEKVAGKGRKSEKSPE